MLLQTQGTNNIRVINPTGSCQDLNEDEITYTIEKEVPTFNNTVTVPTPTTSGLLIETTGQYISYAT